MKPPNLRMSNKFTYRSFQKELLDELNIPTRLLHRNLKELDILNRVSGGHRVSLKGIKQLITDRDKIYHVVDLGCGSGNAMKSIADWAMINDYKVRLTGVDMNADAIDYLKNHCSKYPEITSVVADYNDYLNKEEVIDIVHCSLFCHHLNDEELFHLFVYFRKHVRVGFVINDLRRNWLTYYSAWLFARLFNGSKLAKNDGPISVLRAFKSKELIRLLTKAIIKDFTIKKALVFRLLIVGKTSNHDDEKQ